MNCINHPEREKVAFCQNCGKPLCQECSRTVGSAVFCEPCLAAKLGSAPPPVSAADRSAYSDPATGVYVGANTYTYVDPVTGARATGVIPPSGTPNPWLAAFLGFVPGVGAMYNEQYAKGIIHLVVFAILVSLSDSHDIFGLFVAGWLFYMAIEAFHTARARRDGLPLPNPFGLNDLGERLGFGRSWGSASTPVPAPAPSAVPFAPQHAAQPFAATPIPDLPPSPPPAAGWSSVPQPTYTGYVAPPPIGQVPLDSNVHHPGARFPVGAIWLIGLGVIFLLASSDLFHGFWGLSSRTFMPLLLIGLAIWIFFHKMTGLGRTITDDGAADYRYRLYRAIRSSIWVGLIGILFLLNDFDILSWDRSWPLYLIVFGVLAILGRSSWTNPAPVYPYRPPPTFVPAPPSEPAASATAATASEQAPLHDQSLSDQNLQDQNLHDQEGR